MRHVNNILYDAIIVGAGHNGLVAANYLANAGYKVLIAEKRHLPGGAAMTQELIPGFKFSRFSYLLSLFRKNIMRQLELQERGLKVYFRQISSLTPTKNQNEYLLFHKDQNKTKQQISKFSQSDAAKWDNYNQFLNQISDYWNKQLDDIPYNYVDNPTLKLKVKYLKNVYPGNLNVFELSKFVTTSVQSMLDKWFDSSILKATLATDGVIGENISIQSPSSAYVLLHHVMGQLFEGRKGQWGYVEGGNGKLSQILAERLKQKKGQILYNSPVSEILYQQKVPTGIRLENGQQYFAKHILSNCTNKVTFDKLVPNYQQYLGRQATVKLKKIQYNGACTKINLAIKKLPKFRCFKNHQLPPEKLLQGTLHINCQTMQNLKRAFEQTKSHRFSINPFLDITIPSIFDKTLCPQGYHIMNVLMQYTPYHPNNGSKSTPIDHEIIRQRFLNTINSYLQQPLDVHYMDILTPHDLENILGLTQGNIFHGAIGLDNIFVNRESGKLGGIWLTGSSAHPGGGVMGAVGRQVAQQIIRLK